MKKGVFVLGFLLVIGLIGIASAEVRINEVSPRTPEYIELYNPEPSNVSLTNWIIGDLVSNDTFSLNISVNGFALIVRDDEGCGYYGIPSENCFSLSSIGSGLNDGAEQIHLYDNNSILISSFSWTNSNASLSWQYCSGNWLGNSFSYGTANNCTVPAPTCSQSFSCSNSTCASSSITQTCYNITSNCQSINTTQTFTCATPTSEYIELNWTDEIFNKEEFEIEVNMFNLLSQSYDVKVWITFNNNDTTISEIYDTNDDSWGSGFTFISNFISGAGNKTKDVKIRLKEDYQDFDGNARIYARIRVASSSTYIDDYERTFPISASDETTTTTTSRDTNDADIPITTSSVNSGNDEEVIVLGSSSVKTTTPKTPNSIIYKSKMEYIKDYAPYALCAVCIFIIIIFMIDKKGNNRRKNV